MILFAPRWHIRLKDRGKREVFLHFIDRFLACHKSGIQFTPEEVDVYSNSWVKSCETTRQLFDLVKTMQPHETKKTLSLNG